MALTEIQKSLGGWHDSKEYIPYQIISFPMARKHEDERFRLALQRLSSQTGVPLREDDDWETRAKIANDGSEPTYRARVTKILMTNEHEEEEELFRGTKADVTAQINVMNRLLTCADFRRSVSEPKKSEMLIVTDKAMPGPLPSGEITGVEFQIKKVPRA